MKAVILAAAEEELEQAFDYYELQRPRLGVELLEEFRHGLDQIVEYPEGWRPLGGEFRRYRLHRFPFGIVYKFSRADDVVVIHAFMRMSRKPRKWQPETA